MLRYTPREWLNAILLRDKEPCLFISSYRREKNRANGLRGEISALSLARGIVHPAGAQVGELGPQPV